MFLGRPNQNPPASPIPTAKLADFKRASETEVRLHSRSTQGDPGFLPPPQILSFRYEFLKRADVAQLQGARCDGMAHAISSLVQRRRWAAAARFRLHVAVSAEFFEAGAAFMILQPA